MGDINLMKNRDLRKQLHGYEDVLFKAVLNRKIHIQDIPFEVRRNYPGLYSAAKRASRSNEENFVEFIKFIFYDYDCLLKADKGALEKRVDDIVEMDKNVLEKNNIQPPKDFKSRYPRDAGM